jgi:hypothetical protein
MENGGERREKREKKERGRRNLFADQFIRWFEMSSLSESIRLSPASSRATYMNCREIYQVVVVKVDYNLQSYCGGYY